MYKHIAVGGTFDGLHTGHQAFLRRAFEVGMRVTIGLTSEVYIRRFKKAKGIAPYSRRYNALTSWLRKSSLSERATIIPIDNPVGPAVMGDFDAMVVTSDSRANAQMINKLRNEQGLSEAVLIEVPLVIAQDLRPLSGSRVRSGEIDRAGKLMMPDAMRSELQKPLGRVLVGPLVEQSILSHRDAVTITVGDITTQTLFSFGVQPSLAVIDLFVERKPYQSFEAYKFPKKYHVVRVRSGPGFIAKKAVKAIQEWSNNVKERTVLVVAGEEDLLVIPAIIHGPIGSIVYYGQPKAGLVELVVTLSKKQEAIELLKRFT